MFAVSLALLAQEWRGPERATATAIYGATIGVAVALGPLVGGALTQAIGWQSIFFLNIPVGVAAIAVTLLRVRESRDETARGVDWGGTVTFSAANALLVLALLRGNDDGWTSTTIVSLLVAAIVLFVAFVLIELRVSQPMLPLGLFRNHAFTGAQITAFALSGSMFALFLYITLYMQEIEHLSPLQAGLRYLPFTVGSFFVAGATASLEGKVPPRVLLASGLAITGVGLALMSGAEPNDSWTVLLPGFIVGGLGVGLVNPVLANVALSTVPERMSGVASGINDTFRQVAIASGTAGLGALFLALSQQRIEALLPGASGPRARGLAEAVSSGSLPSGVPAPVVHAAREGFTHGFSIILLVGSGLALVGAVLALLLVRDSDLRHDEMPVAGTETGTETAPGAGPAAGATEPAAA
jgi:predicted MFS family arabinose efflux permease